MSALRQASPRAGRLVPQQQGPEGFSAFVPNPLPPDPPVLVDPLLQASLDRANQALGRLDGVSLLLPDPELFLYSFVRKEAVLSSQIEGAQSSLSDLLLYEHDAAPSLPRGDTQEASNYVAAIYRGIRLRAGDLTLSSRLLREVHRTLMSLGSPVRRRGTSAGACGSLTSICRCWRRAPRSRCLSRDAEVSILALDFAIPLR